MRRSITLGLLLLFTGRGDRALPTAPAHGEAVGRIADCTGTLVAPGRVLTARHCHVHAGDVFCPGEASRRGHCVVVVEVAAHPDLDLAVATVRADARLDSITPVAIVGETLDDRWTGREVEWAGVGERENGKRARAFVHDSIAGVNAKVLLVGAPGRRGACFGDSGGPVFVTDRSGSPSVAGVLHAGDPECRGADEYTRVDQAREWIRAATASTGAPTPR